MGKGLLRATPSRTLHQITSYGVPTSTVYKHGNVAAVWQVSKKPRPEDKENERDGSEKRMTACSDDNGFERIDEP